jgi:putative restriction endonuclease
MKAYVGVTDYFWYSFLKEQNPDEVNFWQPSGNDQFKALRPGELFLFKLKGERNAIAGGGFFVRSSILPDFLAWEAFGPKNGAATFDAFNLRIADYKKKNKISHNRIGCVILGDPFFFDEDDWIPTPSDWAPNIVRGKTYAADNAIGRNLLHEVLDRIRQPEAIGEETVRYGVTVTSYRLGQGGFRIAVTDAYNRRCAISGEKTLPILDAAHIKPVSNSGIHSVSNGLLLRTDIHSLYDLGYMTITPDYHIEVSSKLDEEYGNGKLYYSYHGLLVPNLPELVEEQPSCENLRWHNEHIFR